ncbi:MAG: peptidase [Alphaproteobacteria bacterium]
MTESLIAPNTNTHGAREDVRPPGSEEQAASDAAALIYGGPDAETAQTAEVEADAPADEAAPVAYEPFALPQGVEVDTAALEEAQSLFAEARLSQPQAQKLVDLYAAKMNELVQRQISAAESRQKAWVTEVKNDPDLGGRRFESARAAAQRAFRHFGTPELRRTLDELGVSNSPQLFRFFVRVGNTLSEDRYAGAQSSASRLSAAETLYPNSNDK